jgi:hypothetical protein
VQASFISSPPTPMDALLGQTVKGYWERCAKRAKSLVLGR